jgi:four helix bundle protein
MSSINTYRDLLVWQKSITLVAACYRLTSEFPTDERFGLTAQLRRSAVSIPSNIAEGHARGSPKSFIQYLWIANGSLAELETQIVIAEQLGFVNRSQTEDILNKTNEIGRMLTGLRRSLTSSEGENRPA